MSRNWWLFIAIVILLGAVVRDRLLLLVGLLLILVGGAAWLWSRYCLVEVSYRRQLSSERFFHGDVGELAIEVVNAKPLPLAWLITVDEFPTSIELLTGALTSGHRARRRLLVNTLSLRWYERVTRRYRIRAARRGEWSFGPVQISSGDIFGFGVRRMTVEETQSVIVYPKIVPLSALKLTDRHPFGDFRTRRRLMEDPLRILGAREYMPGDSFRDIHWKATAHRQELQTKLLQPSASRPLAIFLNARTSEYINEGIDREILELAVTAAASIAHWAWDEEHEVGLYANTIIRAERDWTRLRIPPGNAPDQLTQILEALARMEEAGLWTLATIIATEGPALRFGSTVVVVTPLLNNRLLRALLDLKRVEHSVTLITLGEARLEREIAGVRSYHLGGRELWDELERLELAT